MSVSDRDQQAVAFESFFVSEQPRLVAIALGWSGDVHAAREAAQEALSRAFRDWGRVSALDVPEAWVRRVLINLLIDQQRRQHRDQVLVDRLGPPGLVPAPVHDDEAWWDAVRALPDRQRAVITLHYLEDRSVREVAEILEIATGTVKATLSQARDRLRVMLVEEDLR